MFRKLLIASGFLLGLLVLGGMFMMNNRLNILANQPVTPKAPTTVLSVGECSTGTYCMRFKHEAELVLPQVTAGNCEPYRMPEFNDLPSVSELNIDKETSSEEVSDTLVKYVEKVLDADKASKAALLKHYQDYLASCTKTAPAPSTPTK